MTRTALAVAAEVVLALIIAVLLGAAWQWFLTGELAAATGEALRLLFFFMDVGLAVWVIALIVLTVRRRRLPGMGETLVWALVGVAVNAVVVLVVGLVQGGWAALFVLFAIEAGVAFLVAVLIAAPVIHRLFAVKSPGSPAPQP